MDTSLQSAFLTASISAGVALIVSGLSPLWSHIFWRRQKHKEQQLAIAERYAVLAAAIAAGSGLRDPEEESAPRKASDRREFEGLLFLIPVLFTSAEVIDRVSMLRKSDTPKNYWRVDYELQAHLFAEALDLPFKLFFGKKTRV